MRTPNRQDLIAAIRRAEARPKSQKQIQAEGREARRLLKELDKKQKESE